MKITLSREYEIRSDWGKSVSLVRHHTAVAKKDGKDKEGNPLKKGDTYPGEKVLGYYPTVAMALKELIRWEMAEDKDYASFNEYLAEFIAVQDKLDAIIDGLDI